MLPAASSSSRPKSASHSRQRLADPGALGWLCCDHPGAPMTRRYIAIEKYGPSGALELREGPVPSPGDDEIAIDVAYSGINFADIMMRLGFYPDAPKKPFVPGYEVAGVIAEVGRNVRDFRPGDPV